MDPNVGNQLPMMPTFFIVHMIYGLLVSESVSELRVGERVTYKRCYAYK